MEREVVFAERMEVCQSHQEKAEIFWLEQMLIKAGFPYSFNFWEDLKPVFGGDNGADSESIDWDTYKFLIEVGHPAGAGLSQISVCFNTDGDSKLLEILDMRPAEGKENPTSDDGELYSGLSAEQAMEIIEKFFETA